MKKLIFLTITAFCSATLLSYKMSSPNPKPLSPECYVACFNHAMEAFQADASSTEFASWHLNPIPFTLQNPTGKTIEFTTEDGKNASGYFIPSKQKTKNFLFVIQEWWGLNDYIKQEAEYFASTLGNTHVIALDLYDGKVATTAQDAMKYVQAASKERIEAIIKGAIAYAGKDANIYTVGWCFGGMWSLQASLLAGSQAAGCVMYYGRPENDVERLKKLNCEVIGFFGLQDRSPSPEMVQQFQKDMAAAGKKLSVINYDAGHAFANPSNPRFNKEAREDAMAKTIAFLKEKMK